MFEDFFIGNATTWASRWGYGNKPGMYRVTVSIMGFDVVSIDAIIDDYGNLRAIGNPQ